MRVVSLFFSGEKVLSLSSFRHKSTFVNALLQRGLFDHQSFSLIDVGCSGGIDPFWRQFGKSLRAVGFDPLVSEVERLNSEENGCNIRYVAAWIGEGDRQLPPTVRIDSEPGKGPYSTFALSSASRAYETTRRSIIAEVFNRGAELRFAERRLSVDEWLAINDFGPVDALKCDVDGFDFEVFVGARELLSSPKKPLAVITEAQLHEPRDRHGTAFGDLDRYLRDHGYRLFNIDIHNYSRAELPAPFLITLFAQTSTGQAVHCDALYMLDPVMDPGVLDEMLARDDQAALFKLVVLYEAFGLPDCAASLLVRLREVGVSPCDLDIGWALDWLTPENPYGATTHSAYLDAFAANPQLLFPKSSTSDMGTGMVLDWSENMFPADGCTRDSSTILSPMGRGGHMCFGPYLPLPSGSYRGTIILDVEKGGWAVRQGKVLLEAVGNEVTLAQSLRADLRSGAHVIDVGFDVPEGDRPVYIQLRLSVDSSSKHRMRRAMVEKLA